RFKECRADALESLRRQEVAQLDEAVTIEGVAPSARYSRGEPLSPPRGHAVRKPQPGDVQAASVERLGAENRIVGEALRSGAKRQQPQRRAPPAEERAKAQLAVALRP